jgi:hypothetical protein
MPLLHPRLELDPFAGDHEVAVAKVMDRLRADHRPVEPRPDDLQPKPPPIESSGSGIP